MKEPKGGFIFPVPFQRRNESPALNAFALCSLGKIAGGRCYFTGPESTRRTGTVKQSLPFPNPGGDGWPHVLKAQIAIPKQS